MTELSDKEKKKVRRYDLATSIMLPYQAPELPLLGNTTPEALVDQIGYLKELQKDAEKVENILWQRLSALQGGGHPLNSQGIPTPDPCQGDIFSYTVGNQEREMLNQAKAKEILTEIGRLSECYGAIQVKTKFVREK
jgi:hypothetical protein